MRSTPMPTSLCDFGKSRMAYRQHGTAMHASCNGSLLRQSQSPIPASTKLLTQPHITASLSKVNHRNSRTTPPCDSGRLTQRTCTGRKERQCMRCDSAMALLRQNQSRIPARAKLTARPHLSNPLCTSTKRVFLPNESSLHGFAMKLLLHQKASSESSCLRREEFRNQFIWRTIS